ncbi:MAG: alpha/beta fold hydrolase [Gammaproteobacteria bacterium]|nr:alpha/beta fold hydrolase [Gammaproteobacteria bacterium]MBT8150420.1 alpha/beta fold hydrolase [Gammaproteobacteria bacterium]NNL11908.1 alpha/beta fold hydrolase [Pseudomonadales bacterium]NNM11778.1 alpha/beta fold hydrolase [Pseudomonadales bacterium]RZV54168.1 MAG: alpha/beta fold hydrolase [Pseudomonadales bacterium]
MSVVSDLDQVFDVDYKTTLIDLEAGGCMPVRIIKPSGYGPHPVVVLLMGMSGVDPSLCSLGRLIAEEGYAVAIPDLYHDNGRRTEELPEDFDAALEAMSGLREKRAMEDMAAMLEFIDSRRDMDGTRVSLLGHCLGGRLSLVAGSYFPGRFRCIASYYASGMDACMTSLDGIDVPTQLVSAGQSLFACEESLQRVESELRRSNQFVQRLSFDDAAHNFLDATDRNYDPSLAAEALYRTFEFIQSNSSAVA